MEVRFNPLRVNHPVEIVDGPKSYASRVEGVERTRVTVAAPMAGGSLVYLPVGRVVTLACLRTDPMYAGRYEAETEVLGHSRTEPPFVFLAAPTVWRKVQLRNYVRVQATLPVACRRVEEDGQEGEAFQAETQDISGGGLRLILKSPLKAGAALQVLLHLPEGPVFAGGKVEWVGIPGGQPLMEGETVKSGEPVVAGIRFTEIDERDRDRIVRFVFQRQAEMRRKGLA